MIPSRCQDNIIIQFDELNEVYHHFADSGFTAQKSVMLDGGFK